MIKYEDHQVSKYSFNSLYLASIISDFLSVDIISFNEAGILITSPVDRSTASGNFTG
jgi:hypothetical protein